MTQLLGPTPFPYRATFFDKSPDANWLVVWHQDDSEENNGPLRVLPGTHQKGVFSDDEIDELAERKNPVTCWVRRGGVLAMRPLIVHASSKSQSQKPRRVLHIEYAPAQVLDGFTLAPA